MPPDELTAAIGELAPVLARRPEGVFARLALTAGAFVEWGGSALPLAAHAPACALAAMRLRARFSELWPAVAGGRPEPGPEQEPGMADLTGLFAAAAERLALAEREATSIALAWFDARHWVNLMITVMARREFRDAAGLLPEIGDAAERLGDSVPRAHWLPGLAQVLDDEPVVVIDNATGRGFRLIMSGVGDNFQLHTLLADRLTGDPAHGLLAGERPAPAWVAAATLLIQAQGECGLGRSVWQLVLSREPPDGGAGSQELRGVLAPDVVLDLHCHAHDPGGTGLGRLRLHAGER